MGFRRGGATRFENGEVVNDTRFGGWNFFIYAPEAYTVLPADEFLEDAVSLLRSWRPQFANDPASEDAFIARYQLGRFHLRKSFVEETGGHDTTFRTADAAARELFALQVELLPTGVAQLSDAAIAWELRDELAEILAAHGGVIPMETEQELQSDLDELMQLGRFTSDRRGRLQADLTYIELLGTRQEARRALVQLQNSGRDRYAP